MKHQHEAGAIYSNFADPIRRLTLDVRDIGRKVDAGHWQGFSTTGHPDLVTRELMNVQFGVKVDRPARTFYEGFALIDLLAQEINPNRAWADEHFAERVGGEPLNPDPSYENWPWWQGQDISKQAEDGKFTHTYSERFWPKHAGEDSYWRQSTEGHFGLRYHYGDLNDLKYLLRREKYTRQAYLPIFFPEDTGSVHMGRIPCTLGYHFLVRPDHEGQDQLHMWYFLRSCDLVRHFRDDIYLAVLLMLWVLDNCWTAGEVEPGTLHMSIPSLHIHMGDIHHVSG